MRNPLVVLENTKRILKNNGSDEDVATYIMSEGYTPEEISKIPVPKNLTQISELISVGEKVGKAGESLKNAPGLPGELARNPKMLEDGGPLIGQLLGGAVGFTAGGPLGSKVGGAIGATAGEGLSQAIKIVRGEQVSPEAALREVLHTGKIATASEAMFGMNSPGAKLLGKAFSTLSSKVGKSATQFTENIASKIFQATSGRISAEDTMELINKGAANILTKENMGNSISPKTINKATRGLEMMRREASNDFRNVVRPLENNKNLVTQIKPLVDDFDEIAKQFGLIDDFGKPRTGLIGKGDSGKKILAIINKFKEHGESISFKKLFDTKKELEDLVKFATQPMAVSPVSKRFPAALKKMVGRISEELNVLGGEEFEAVNRAFADSASLFDDLFKALKTDETAEKTLETVIKTSKQMRLFKLEDLNARLPKNLRFIEDLENFALAQKFKSEGFNLIRAGIVGSILGFKGAATFGPVGGLAGLTGAYYATTPKGVGQTIKATQQIANLVRTNKGVIQEQARRVLAPLITSAVKNKQ